MSLERIRDAVVQQRQEWKRRLAERYIERDVGPIFDQSADLIRIIIGPRRAGKSFFALHRLARTGGCGYVNFDDERLAALEDYDEVVAAVDREYGNPETLLLDEIQNLPRWELFVNRLQRQGRRLVVTGSNSKLLSRELATHVTGRHVRVVLLPFSFAEVLRADERLLTTAELQARWMSYVEEGGYPEPVLKSVDRGEYLRTLVDAVLYRDIVQRYRVRKTEGLEALARYLFSNVAKEYSYQSLARVTGSRSVATVQKYVGYLEEAFLFFSLPRFSFKVREQEAYNKKMYCVDNGMAVALGFRISGDVGRLAENAVAVSLWRECWNRGWQLFYWKDAQGEEVDFVVKVGRQVRALVQVCWRLDDPKVRAREVRALIKGAEALHCRRLVVLTADEEREERVKWFGSEGLVRYMPIWKWMASSSAGIPGGGDDGPEPG